jgi:SAM-dependent methyltransferase
MEFREDAMSYEWWSTYFGSDYLKIDYHLHTEREAAFIAETLQLNKGGKHLDIGCGYGRHLLPLIAQGFTNIVGSDMSSYMLDEAVRRMKLYCKDGDDVDGQRRVAKWIGSGGALVRCDNRRLPFHGVFDSVCNMFNSFGYFGSETDNYRMLSAVADALKPGGTFLLDLTNRDFVVKLDDRQSWFEQAGAYILEHKWFDPIGNRSEIDVVVLDDEGTREYHHSIRLYSFTEISMLLEAAGLMVTDVYGGFEYEPFTVDCDRMLILARKPGTEDV